MKKFYIVCSFAAALIVGVWAAGATQSKGANFAGTWTLDKAKSEMPQMMADGIQSMTWTVTQDDKQLSREQKIERNQNAQGPEGGRGRGGYGGRGMGMGMGGPLTVKLDGSETTSDNQRGKSTSKAKWADSGKSLEITTTSTFSGPNGDVTSTTVEHWELADNGKTLKVHRKSETPRGPMEVKFTFTKQ